MSCTTLLVGKDVSYDGAPIIARDDDSSQGSFDPKKFIVITPDKQPRHYQSVIGHQSIDLPDNPLRYTACPCVDTKNGFWGDAGINACNVAMSTTETITTNSRVRAADPLVFYVAPHGKKGNADYTPEKIGGFGEEDFLLLVLPYITTAREGVARLGNILEKYGTYESNGIAISDAHEIWWLETIGGHHWIAKRVPDNCYVTMPNQLGIDSFDLDDALGSQKNHMCSADMREFIDEHHLNLDITAHPHRINPRICFGSHSDYDHVYNTPRAWYIQHELGFVGQHTHQGGAPYSRDGRMEDFGPESDFIPWAQRPTHKITIEDVKYALSSHYQGTPFDPYENYGDTNLRKLYRPIGINRQSELCIMEVRPNVPSAWAALQWISYGSNPFNTTTPFYTNVQTTPDYLAKTTLRPTTESYYWSNRIIGALADAHYHDNFNALEAYRQTTVAEGYKIVHDTDCALKEKYGTDTVSDQEEQDIQHTLEHTNDHIACQLKKHTDDVLDSVIYTSSIHMRNGFYFNEER